MYIGNDLQVAFPSYTLIDDISAGFNGSTTTFALNVSGSAPIPFPINEQQCLISVNNVILKPDATGVTGFKLSGTNIVFAVAPTGGHSFFGVILAGADYVTAGTNFPDGAVGTPSITFDNDKDTGIYRLSSNTLAFTSGGTESIVINSGGFVEFKDGHTLTPSLTFKTDTDTGLFLNGSSFKASS